MGDQQERRPLVPVRRAQQRHQVPLVRGREGGEDLVEDQQLRPACQPPRELEAAEAPLGQLGARHEPLVEQTRPGEEILGRSLLVLPGRASFLPFPCVDREGDAHRLADGEGGVRVGDLEGPRDAEPVPGVERKPGDLLPVEPDRARVGEKKPRENVDERGLPRPVRAEQPHRFPRGDRQGDPGEDLRGAERFRDPFRRQQRVQGVPSPARFRPRRRGGRAPSFPPSREARSCAVPTTPPGKNRRVTSKVSA